MDSKKIVSEMYKKYEPSDRKEYQRKYYLEHKAELKEKMKARYEKRKAMKKCYWCENDISGSYLIYKKKSFCCEKCLAKYLLDKIDGEVEEGFIDTEENLKICAEEQKGE